MIKIDSYAGNPNFSVSTIPQNKIDTKQQENKSFWNKMIAPSIVIGLGAVYGDAYQRGNVVTSPDKVLRKFEKLAHRVNKFAMLPENQENGVIEGATREPYSVINQCFESMQNAKDNPDVRNANCLVFVSKDEAKAKQVIDWFAHASEQKYTAVPNFFTEEYDLLDELEKLKGEYQDTKKWNLLYLKDYDKVLNPKIVDDTVVRCQKSTLRDVAKDYNTTILFQTKDLSQICKDALEPDTIDAVFDLDNMKHFDEYKKIFEKYDKWVASTKRATNPKGLAKFKGAAVGALIGALIVAAVVIAKKIINKNNKEVK